MNVGQILETHLGAASVDLGKKFYSLALGVNNDKSNIVKLKIYLKTSMVKKFLTKEYLNCLIVK